MVHIHRTIPTDKPKQIGVPGAVWLHARVLDSEIDCERQPQQKLDGTLWTGVNRRTGEEGGSVEWVRGKHVEKVVGEQGRGGIFRLGAEGYNGRTGGRE